MTFESDQLEKTVLNDISTEVPKTILDRFVTLTRESGSEDERIAAHHLAQFLEDWQIPYRVHFPTIHLSVPKKATLLMTEPVSREIRAKTPSCSISTGDQWICGEMVYIPADEDDLSDAFDPLATNKYGDVRGKIVLTDGYPVSGKTKELGNEGAVGVIFISPGRYIHEGTIGVVWGSPDLDTMNEEPQIPALMIGKQDGNELIHECQAAKVTLQFQTHLDTGWFPCPLIDIWIEGTDEPEKYVLLHGHLDSWHQGIGDNGTGNAALMEMARLFHKHRHLLKRSIRIAVWPGHSTGRYAGSTWFADQFGLDLDENCIAQVNCDSPGCRWATSYEDMSWMSEAEELCQSSIQDAVGEKSKGFRPHRAGDYSFNNIGITSFYMLSSSIPAEQLKAKGYYAVGGCGSNIEWHSEEDLMHVADLDILVRDIRVYMTTILRVVNSPIHPFFFSKTVEELLTTIEEYEVAAAGHFSFSVVKQEAIELLHELQEFYRQLPAPSIDSVSDPHMKRVNEIIRLIGRELVTINYSCTGKFRHDLAIDMPRLPDLAAVHYLSNLNPVSHTYKVALTHLTRGQNRVAWTLQRVRKLLKNGSFDQWKKAATL
ncbi:M28 family peptidase [Brevibacillus sp. NRS-1366]|uniref:M28 family peptidase n=1 Tax=Brevibacillus sp. NRS-1366 TaxID=3233899 RepID=UPI003D206EC9